MSRHGVSMDDYRALSVHDRYHLLRAVQKYRQALYGEEEINPEEGE